MACSKTTPPHPRLLTRLQAAAYCGVSVNTFKAVCPVEPIAFNVSKRLRRYDVCDLDKWIDSLGDGVLDSGRDWLAALDRPHDDHPR